MPNYLNGKIYKITGINEKGEWVIYIGSTCQKLCSRMTGHRRDTNTCKSKIIFETCSNITITLIKSYPCNNIDELNAEERSYYDQYDCVNVRRPILYEGEREEYLRQYNPTYRKEHKKEIAEYQAKYNALHKEEIAEYMLKYNQAHKEVIIEQKSKYYEEHKKVILEKQVKNYEKNKCEFKCDCGSVINNKLKIKEHEKTKKHLNFLEQNK